MSHTSKTHEKLRFGVVGLGWFAQTAVLPAFRHAADQVELTALFSSDAEKLDELGDRYDVSERHDYDALEAVIESGTIDAVYLAVPNHLHREYVLRAAGAGAHVLCEKPLGVTEEECREMIEAADEAGVQLMTAYRLHFEEANLKAVKIARSGRLGEVRSFEAMFATQVHDDDNIRLGPIEKGGGTLYDIGIYCLNAARYIFGDEPVEVMAMSASSDDERFRDCDEMSAAILRFPGDRLATFTSSFSASDHDHYTVYGTEGNLRVEPAFQFAGGLAHRLTLNGQAAVSSFPKRDQIAPELLHFAECVRSGERPEPSGLEGLADVRVIEALYRSARQGKAVRLDAIEVDRRPDPAQERYRPPVGKQKLVAVDAPSDD